MVTTLFVDLMSQPCRALAIFVKMNAMPCNIQTVALRKGENKTPEFLSMNPLGKVPVLKDEEFCLTESIAILRYLDTKYGSSCLYPKSIRARAKVDEFLEWQHTNTRMFAAKVFLGEVLFPGAINIEQAVNDMNAMLDSVESMFLKDKNFIAGETVSVADHFAVCELLQTTISGRDLFKDRPKLQSWLDRVRKDSNPHFDDVHSVLYSVRRRYIKNKL
uniref:Glutathione S-transferase theta-1-like n=1 Tax=Phallusia mammillata TaxID=59560 RepID=A0A6F9DEC6_9ASCI|nr:glutathione S-transferase theta-1-like [Phallusia mammillata]